MIGFELGLKISFNRWIGVGGLCVDGWMEQVRIRLTSASTGVGVEVEAEDHSFM